MNKEERRNAYHASEQADWTDEPMVDENGKLHLPKDILKAIDAPLRMAFDLTGDAMNSQAAYEDCTPDQKRARGVWHALHYVQRRLSGWDKLPDNFLDDELNWYAQTEWFKKDANESVV